MKKAFIIFIILSIPLNEALLRSGLDIETCTGIAAALETPMHSLEPLAFPAFQIQMVTRLFTEQCPALGSLTATPSTGKTSRHEKHSAHQGSPAAGTSGIERILYHSSDIAYGAAPCTHGGCYASLADVSYGTGVRLLLCSGKAGHNDWLFHLLLLLLMLVMVQGSVYEHPSVYIYRGKNPSLIF